MNLSLKLNAQKKEKRRWEKMGQSYACIYVHCTIIIWRFPGVNDVNEWHEMSGIALLLGSCYF